MQIYSSAAETQCTSAAEEKAATKIQAGFRGYRVRKQLRCKRHYRGNKKQKIMSCNENTDPQNKTMGNQRECENSGKAENIDLSVEEQCATKIQAGVRGYLVRKQKKIENVAATKIQAGFRGFKARQEVQKLKHQ